jgi:dienelactone hydrolase
VINLNSGSKIQAYIPKPPKKTVVGIIFLVDPKLGFGSASSRGLAEELSAQAEFLVLCPDLTMYREAEGGVSPDQAAAMIHEAQGEIEDSVNELKRRGALRIGIVGFGQAANLAITCTAKSGIFLASCLFCGDVNIGYLSSVETPVLGVFCGNDESVPTSRAAAIGSALKTLSSKGVPTRLKLFEDQTPDFVEAESPATEAAVDEMCDFFSEFLDVADSEEWRIGA